MFELADPEALLLLPLPLLALWLLSPRSDAGRALRLPMQAGQDLLKRAAEAGSQRTLPIAQGALWLSWGLMIVALSGPRDLAPVSALKVSGRDLALVLDLSGSMVRDDFFLDGQQITRLEAVQKTGAAFARRRGGDRLALIVFGSQAFYASPFTFDKPAQSARPEDKSISFFIYSPPMLQTVSRRVGLAD